MIDDVSGAPTGAAGICSYCGRANPETRDHVPAKTLFPRAPKENLVTVPACTECHAPTGPDDEYFRDVVIKHYRVADQPVVAPLIEKMFRNAARPEARRYLEATVASMMDVPARSLTGDDLGVQTAYSVDAARVKRVVARYVRGLHMHELGRVVAEDEVVVTVHPDALADQLANVKTIFARGVTRTIDDEVFWYRYRQVNHGDLGSVWLLVFFQEFAVLGAVRRTAA